MNQFKNILLAILLLPLLAPAGNMLGVPTGMPPVIDGEIQPAEWENASKVRGFCAMATGEITPYATELAIFRNGTAYFIALKCTKPAGAEFRAVKRQRDNSVFKDDSVELFFFSPSGNLYNFIVNAAGSLMDGKNGEYANWNFDFPYAVSDTSEAWSFECAVDLAKLEPGAPADGWKVNFARSLNREIESNHKQAYAISSQLASAENFTETDHYFELQSMGKRGLDITRNAKISPGNQWLNIVFPHWDNLWRWECTVRAGQKVIAHTDTNLDGIRTGQFVLLPDVPAFNGDAEIEYTLTDGKTKVHSARYRAGFHQPFAVKVYKYFLSKKGFYIQFSPFSTGKRNAVKTELALKDAAGKSVWQEAVVLKGDEKELVRFADCSDIAPGEYTLAAQLLDAQKQLLVESTMRLVIPVRPDWVDTPITQITEVPKPWIAVQSHEDSGASVWGRSYSISSENGLFDAITTQNHPLFTAPQCLSIAVNKEPQRLRRTTQKVVRTNELEYVHEAEFDAQLLRIRITTVIEFDGFTRHTLTLTPHKSDLKLTRLQLEIHLVPEAKSLWYGPREDYDFYRLESWSKTMAMPEAWDSPFRPAMSFFAPEYGLQWYCESSRNWHNQDKNKRLTIRANNTEIIFTANIIDLPTDFSKPVTYEWGEMATPVKPIPANWRDFRFAFRPLNYWGDENEPNNLLRYGAEHGVRYTYLHEPWTNNIFNSPTTTIEKEVGSFIKGGSQAGVKVLLYCSDSMSEWSPEMALYGADLMADPIFERTLSVAPMQKIHLAVWGKGYYERFWVPRFLDTCQRLGASGTYMDRTPQPAWVLNPAFGMGYQDEEGKWIPAYDIFAKREYMKLFYAAAKKMNPDFIFLGHLSDGMVMPSCSFVDYAFGGESFSMKPNAVLNENDIFAEYGGFNHGLPTTIYYYGCEAGRELLNPEMVFAWQTLTDAVWWTYGLSARHLETADAPTQIWKMYDNYRFNERQFIPYWSKKAPVSADRKTVRAGVWYQQGNAVQILGVADIAPHQGKPGDVTIFRIPAEWGNPIEVKNLLHPEEKCTVQGHEITIPWEKTWNSAFLALSLEQ